MGTKEERFAQLNQLGFVNVDKWWGRTWGISSEHQQQQLLAVLRNDPLATTLK